MLWITFSVWGKERLFVEKSVLFRRKKSFYRQKGVFFPQLLKLSTKKSVVFGCAQTRCGRVIHRFFMFFCRRLKNCVIFRFGFVKFLIKLSTNCEKWGWTTRFYPQMRWIAVILGWLSTVVYFHNTDIYPPREKFSTTLFLVVYNAKKASAKTDAFPLRKRDLYVL